MQKYRKPRKDIASLQDPEPKRNRNSMGNQPPPPTPSPNRIAAIVTKFRVIISTVQWHATAFGVLVNELLENIYNERQRKEIKNKT